jgi:competence protein ComEC
LNDASVVCKVTFGNVSVLFTGDLEEAGDRELLASGLPLQADVLKASHHGGKGTSSHEFLRAVRPKAVVLSAPYPGRNNLPHPSTLQRFSEIGADVYWTGRDGAVLFSSDGKTFRIKGLKHPKAEKQYR